MKKKTRKADPFFEGYTIVDTGDTVTFGTSVWTRDEGFGVIIVFPAGQMMKYAPQEEIDQLSHLKEQIKEI